MDTSEARLQHEHSRERWAINAAFVGVILLATALRLHGLGADSLWFDEIQQARTAVGQTPQYIIARHVRQAAAPLDPLLTGLVSNVGQSEFLLRFPAAFLAILTVALHIDLGRRLFGPREGLIAGLLLTISTLHVQYAQEVRTYSLLTFLAALALWLFWHAWRLGSSRYWVAWVVVALLGTLAHTSAILFVLAQISFASLPVVLAIRERSKPHLVLWRPLAWPFAGAAFALATTTVRFALASAKYAERLAASAEVRPNIVLRSLALTGYILREASNGTGLLPAYLVPTLSALIRPPRRQTSAIVLLALSCVIPGVGALIAGFQTFNVRYVIFILIPYLLLAARGITALGDWARQRIIEQQGLRPGAFAIPAIAAILLSAFSIGPIAQYYAQDKEDWRGLSQYLAQRVGAGDLVIADGIGLLPGRDQERTLDSLDYYFPAGERGVQVVGVQQIGADRDIHRETGRVWAAVFDPDDLAQQVERTIVHRFPKVALIELERQESFDLDVERMLRALLVMQPSRLGRLHVHLALARVCALRADPISAQAELAAAREIGPVGPHEQQAIDNTTRFVDRLAS